MKKETLKRILLTAWISLALIFLLWIYNSYQSFGVDESFFNSTVEIQVQETDDYYMFKPQEDFKNVLFFYPGALVDPKAYVPLCREISKHEIKVYLIKMPWRMPSL